MNPENPGINLPKTERPEEAGAKLILPTAEEIRAQVEGGLDERAAQEGEKETEHLQATLDQVKIENKIVSKGVLDRFSGEAKKAFLIFFASCTFLGAAGSFSKAEAGDRSLFSQVGDTIKGGIVDQVRGGFQRGERSADARQQMGMDQERMRIQREEQAKMQVDQMLLQEEMQKRQLAIQVRMQREQAAQQMQVQREQIAQQKEAERMRNKERLIQAEADRFMRAIAAADASKIGAEEAKHEKITQAIEKAYPDESQYGQTKKDDGPPRSFAPRSM